MKNKLKKIAAVLLTLNLCLGFISCTKDPGPKGDTGTAGSNGANGILPTYTDGFIKGNVVGTRKDGTPFNEAFDFQNMQ